MKLHNLSWPVAALLAIHATDLPRTLIDVLGLPIPQLWGNMPHLMPFVAITGAALWYIARQWHSDAWITIHDFMFLLVLGTWSLIEGFHRLDGHRANYSLVLDQLWFFVAYYATRMHLMIFGNAQQLIRMVDRLVTLLLLTHLALLIAYKMGLSVPGLSAGELVQRNGISQLGVLVIFFRWFLSAERRPIQRDIFSPITLLVVAQIWANHARAAGILLFLLIVIRVLQALRAHHAVVTAFLLSSAIGLSSAAILGHKLLSSIGGWLILAADSEATRYENFHIEKDVTDAQRSAMYRLASNRFTGEAFTASPALGIGTYRAMQVRVGGYMSHTYYLIAATAFGLLGLVPYLVWSALFFRYIGKYNAHASLIAASLVWWSMTFVNDVLSWYALLFALLAVRFCPRLEIATPAAQYCGSLDPNLIRP